MLKLKENVETKGKGKTESSKLTNVKNFTLYIVSCKDDYERIRNELISVFERLIPEHRHLFTSLQPVQSADKQAEYQNQMEKWYEQDISVKQALESLNNELNSQSQKLDHVLRTLKRELFKLHF